jgi:hypothetical protein
MTPQEFLTSKGIDVNEVIRVNGNVVTVCELLKSYAEIRLVEFVDSIDEDNDE